MDSKGVRFFTRNGHDWTSKLSHLAKALTNMKLSPGWLDGEIIAPAERGQPSFQVLQNAFESARSRDIVYYVFDVPYYDGYDLTRVALSERRVLLESLLSNAPPPILLSQAFAGLPGDLLKAACGAGLEGIIGKRKRSLYASRRSPDWIKLKCGRRQEFVIGGWTDPKGSRTGLGSLSKSRFPSGRMVVICAIRYSRACAPTSPRRESSGKSQCSRGNLARPVLIRGSEHPVVALPRSQTE